jgi:hypothetical protein
MAVIINASTSTGLVQSADTSGIIQFQSNGSTKATLNSSGFSYPGAVLQVVQVTKTDAFSTTSNSFVDITGLSASITPTSATSKILVLSTVSAAGNNATCGYYLKLLRGSTDIFIGDAAGSRIRVTASNINSDNNFFTTNGLTFLDSPATTSSTTYKFQIATSFGTSTIGVNRSVNDTDNANTGRGPSSIVLMEIAA